jgi:recombinational DNA repair protein (RecF pathway)
MSLVKPLFLASIASLTLMMTSMSSIINLLQQMGILPTLGTCSNCSSQTGAYKSVGLYNYFRCSNCKKKQSLLQNTFLSNSNTTLHDYVLLMYQSSHLQYCCKGNFPASTTEKVKVYTHKIV